MQGWAQLLVEFIEATYLGDLKQIFFAYAYGRDVSVTIASSVVSHSQATARDSDMSLSLVHTRDKDNK